MRVLIGCERSGVIRRAFANLGQFAVSVDLEPAEDGAPWGEDSHGIGWHYQGDLFDFLDNESMPGNFDLFIVHPECRYLSSSGLHRNKRDPGRQKLTDEAMEFGLRCWRVNIPRVCLENSVGSLTRRLRELGVFIQFVQPYHYGADASKATGLALRGLPPLRPTKFVEPRMIDGKPRWGNQTDGGQNKLGPSPTRSMDRARTYPGIAKAMAEQWGGAL
jgi:hypothetical protein